VVLNRPGTYVKGSRSRENVIVEVVTPIADRASSHRSRMRISPMPRCGARRDARPRHAFSMGRTSPRRGWLSRSASFFRRRA